MPTLDLSVHFANHEPLGTLYQPWAFRLGRNSDRFSRVYLVLQPLRVISIICSFWIKCTKKSKHSLRTDYIIFTTSYILSTKPYIFSTTTYRLFISFYSLSIIPQSLSTTPYILQPHYYTLQHLHNILQHLQYSL